MTKDFPAEVANGSFATFTLYDESKQQVGKPVTVRKPDQAVGVFTIPAYGKYFVRETAVSGDMMLNDKEFGPLTYSETNQADNLNVPNKANVGSLTVELCDEKKEKLGTKPAAIDYVNAADLAKFTVSVAASKLAKDSYAYRALLETGFVPDETTNTLVYTGGKGASQAVQPADLRRSEQHKHGADVHGEAGAGGAEIFQGGRRAAVQAERKCQPDADV